MKTIVVTGGAGLVGRNLVAGLNRGGRERIVIIDSLDHGAKWKNLLPLKFLDFLDYRLGVEAMEQALSKLDLEAVFHVGANTDVLVRDARLMTEANLAYSRCYLGVAINRSVPFIYASSSAVYGTSKVFSPSHENERPLNPYALSKWMFDNYVRGLLESAGGSAPIVGVRFFNVYGQPESHKGRNASIPFRFYELLKTKGTIELFAGADEIRRDYIGVGDVVRVLMRALEAPPASGIYNLGSGVATSHRRVAEIVVEAFRRAGKLGECRNEAITTVSFPEELKDSFQFFTCAEDVAPWITELGLTAPSTGIARYVDELIETGV
jgi:ADP-L-glycero-D-manno-heptose 6-epimerase